MLIFLPYLLSFLIGFILIRIVLKSDTQSSIFFKSVLAAGLGLGISSHLTFLSFLIFNQLNAIFVIALHFFLLGILTICDIRLRRKSKTSLFQITPEDVRSFFPLILFLVLSIPLWTQSIFYAHGGWDAWSTWNLKARFLFYGGENWQNMFSPILWRSSPHYPIFLPLINVWGWCFQKSATLITPTLTSFIFALLTVSLVFTGLKRLTQSHISLLPAVFLLTLPLFHKLSYSQYSDNILGFYLLAGMISLIFALKEDNKAFALISGLFLGFLSFSKGEGLLAAALVGFWGILYIFLTKKDKRVPLLKYLCGGAILGGLPTVIFTLFYTPDNVTFTNGLTSTLHPSELSRFKMICSFYLIELSAPVWNLLTHLEILKYDAIAETKWQGFWVVLLLMLAFSKGRCFNKKLLLIPLFLLSYTAVITFYYFLNTHFAIGWWLQVTLHRILFAILPTALFWGFASLWIDKKQ